ncbi:MAG: metallophosphoesterase [Puniceicoccales bacterium]|jgi:predicted phosphodiesterase|nr:metallophosphoesterase [Puniceicoccales bacterium]
MKNPAWFLIAMVTLLCAGCSSKSDTMHQPKPIVKFGLIADIQYGDCEANGNRFYRESLDKLSECVADLNQENVQFTVNLGDVVDRSPSDFEPVLSRLSQLNSKVYSTTGNHDYGGIKNNEELFQKLGMPSEYYSFSKGNWRFIMLNTNEVSSYSNVSGTWKEQELTSMREQIKKAGKKNGQPWNGGISSRQMNWLRDELISAQGRKMHVLVFAHHPLYPDMGLTALNSEDILNLLSEYPCVKGVISGHHHTGAFGTYKNIPCITTEGMVETKEANAYGIVSIFEDKITLTGKGRTKSYTLPFNHVE